MADPRTQIVKPPDSGPTSLLSRPKLVQALVLKAYACAGSQQPDELVLQFEAAAWDEALTAAGVPDAALNAVYARAIGAHTSPYRLGTGELIAAWQALRDERAAAVPPPAPVTREVAWAEAQANILSLQERLARIG